MRMESLLKCGIRSFNAYRKIQYFYNLQPGDIRLFFHKRKDILLAVSESFGFLLRIPNGVKLFVYLSRHIRIPRIRLIYYSPLELGIRVLCKGNPLRIIHRHWILSKGDFSRICRGCSRMSYEEHGSQFGMLYSIQRDGNGFLNCIAFFDVLNGIFQPNNNLG